MPLVPLLPPLSRAYTPILFTELPHALRSSADPRHAVLFGFALRFPRLCSQRGLARALLATLGHLENDTSPPSESDKTVAPTCQTLEGTACPNTRHRGATKPPLFVGNRTDPPYAYSSGRS